MADLQSQAGAAPPSSPDYKHRIRTASRLTPIDQDVQADACGRRRFTMGRGSGAEMFRFGVVGRSPGPDISRPVSDKCIGLHTWSTVIRALHQLANATA